VNGGVDAVPEPLLNARLRRADWRFLLANEGVGGVLPVNGTGNRALREARERLQPGGVVLCRRRYPLPGGAQLLRRRLRRAGFHRVRLYWAGPRPGRLPQFWLSLDSAAAARHLLATRPPAGRPQRALRLLWRVARGAGALVPLYAVATVGETGEAEDELAAVLPADPRWLLLTGGQRSVNKVVGLPFGGGGEEPRLVAKFSRVPESDAALEREAVALEAVAELRPRLAGIPRLLARGRRSGRICVAESRIEGRPLIERLSPATLPEISSAVTAWLLELAGEPKPQLRETWWPRLVGEPLRAFEARYGGVLGAEPMLRLRHELESLGDLPLVCEHRDCSPWNVVVSASGLALLDWESAEPSGLPALDLVYFLAYAGFLVDGALVDGRLTATGARDSYLRLLDPATPTGAVAAACLREYRDGLGIDAEALRRLRLLCWVLHSHSEHRHMEMEAAGPPPLVARRESAFLSLIEVEGTHG